MILPSPNHLPEYLPESHPKITSQNHIPESHPSMMQSCGLVKMRKSSDFATPQSPWAAIYSLSLSLSQHSLTLSLILLSPV